MDLSRESVLEHLAVGRGVVEPEDGAWRDEPIAAIDSMRARRVLVPTHHRSGADRRQHCQRR